MTKKKPVRGLTPTKTWEAATLADRLDEINEAVERYVEAERPIPWQWMKEREDIGRRLMVLQVPHP
jgi:hypothetical protein